MIVRQPAEAAIALTIFIAAFLVVGGIYRTVSAVSLKFPHWGFAAFSGIIAINYGWASFTVAGGDVEGYGTDAHYERVLAALVDGLQVT